MIFLLSRGFVGRLKWCNVSAKVQAASMELQLAPRELAATDNWSLAELFVLLDGHLGSSHAAAGRNDGASGGCNRTAPGIPEAR